MADKVGCVMLIDDSRPDNLLHSIAVEESGCADEVISFQRAEVALQKIDAGEVRPDLIFLDINMPRMNGWEFVRAYAELPEERRSAVVVMMLTTSVNRADEERAALAAPPLSGFHRKPLTPEKVREVVASLDENSPT